MIELVKKLTDANDARLKPTKREIVEAENKEDKRLIRAARAQACRVFFESLCAPTLAKDVSSEAIKASANVLEKDALLVEVATNLESDKITFDLEFLAATQTGYLNSDLAAFPFISKSKRANFAANFGSVYPQKINPLLFRKGTRFLSRFNSVGLTDDFLPAAYLTLVQLLDAADNRRTLSDAFLARYAIQSKRAQETYVLSTRFEQGTSETDTVIVGRAEDDFTKPYTISWQRLDNPTASGFIVSQPANNLQIIVPADESFDEKTGGIENAAFDLSGHYVQMELTQASINNKTVFEIVNSNLSARFEVANNVLTASVTEGGANKTKITTPYNAAAHRFLRFRNDAAQNLVLSASSNNADFQTLTTATGLVSGLFVKIRLFGEKIITATNEYITEGVQWTGKQNVLEGVNSGLTKISGAEGYDAGGVSVQKTNGEYFKFEAEIFTPEQGGRELQIGVGNINTTGAALGQNTANYMIVTYFNNLYVISPQGTYFLANFSDGDKITVEVVPPNSTDNSTNNYYIRHYKNDIYINTASFESLPFPLCANAIFAGTSSEIRNSKITRKTTTSDTLQTETITFDNFDSDIIQTSTITKTTGGDLIRQTERLEDDVLILGFITNARSERFRIKDIGKDYYFSDDFLAAFVYAPSPNDEANCYYLPVEHLLEAGSQLQIEAEHAPTDKPLYFDALCITV